MRAAWACGDVAVRKPDSLRAALVAAIPTLSVDPDRFIVYVKDGKLVSRWTTSPAFEYRYRLVVGLLDFAGDPNVVFLALMDWVRTNQNDILVPDRDEDGLTFAADILDPSTADISIELQLTEAVVTTARPGGGWDLAYVDEPADATYGLAAFNGAPEPPAPLGEVWLGDTKIIG